VFPGFRLASLPTATTRDRGRLSLIAAIVQELLEVSADPDIGQRSLNAPRRRTTQALESSISRWVSASGSTIDTGMKGTADGTGGRAGDAMATGSEAVCGPA
jgi:hypothetical protein